MSDKLCDAHYIRILDYYMLRTICNKAVIFIIRLARIQSLDIKQSKLTKTNPEAHLYISKRLSIQNMPFLKTLKALTISRPKFITIVFTSHQVLLTKLIALQTQDNKLTDHSSSSIPMSKTSNQSGFNVSN